VLDKRFALARGPNVVVNGTFDNADGWTLVSGATVAGGKLVLNAPASNVVSAYAAEIGKRYERSMTISDYVSGTVNLNFGGSSLAASAHGSFIGITPTTITATTARILSTGSPVASLDNLSIREIYGSHAGQATLPARPIFQTSPDRFVFDGFDDTHVTTFPAALGNNCTVVRSVPGIGAAITTGQTIGTTYTQTLTHSGLLIFDRPLTASETAAVTRWGNLRAGV